MRVGVAPDPGAVAQRLRDRQPERDAGVLDGVVAVHVQVALRLDGEVEQRVPRERVEHVVEEPDAGAHARPCPGPSRSTRTWRSVSLVVVRVRILADARRSRIAHLDPELAKVPAAPRHALTASRRRQNLAPARSATASMSSAVPTEIRRHCSSSGTRRTRPAPGCRARPAAAGTPPRAGTACSRTSTKLAALGYTVSPGSAAEPGRPVARRRSLAHALLEHGLVPERRRRRRRASRRSRCTAASPWRSRAPPPDGPARARTGAPPSPAPC